MQNIADENQFSAPSMMRTLAFPQLSTAVLIILFAVAGFLLPCGYGLVMGIPAATVQDELSYLVAADTYAQGRLTNPTPIFFEHFETPHVIVEPSYMSKYPPLQGMFLAVGQVLTGKPLVGVWLSCAFFAAALFWMLAAWIPRSWAIITTIATIFLIGFTSYWAQSYWGGMIAAAGGALFFGGLRRQADRLTTSATVIMALGGGILINSRPFEGTLTMLPGLIWLLIQLIRSTELSLTDKLRRIIFPGALVAVSVLGLMGYQFYRVTGSPLKMPYSVHHAQYYPTPLFSFQDVNPDANRGNARIRRMYEAYIAPPALDAFFELGFPDTPLLRSVYGFLYLLQSLPYFLFSPLLGVLFYFAVPVVARSDPRFRLLLVTIGFVFVVVSVGIWWDQYHYVAPLTSVFCVFVAAFAAQIYDSAKTTGARRRVAAVLLLMFIGSVGYNQLFPFAMPRMKVDFAGSRGRILQALETGSAVSIPLPERATFFRHEFEQLVSGTDKQILALVKYEDNYSYHDEMVYNKASLETAQVIWAHDLGEQKNRPLLEHFQSRTRLRVEVDGNRIEITPISSDELK